MAVAYWFNNACYWENFSGPDHIQWTKSEAPKAFEQIRRELPSRFQEKKNIGYFDVFSEIGMEDSAFLSVFTLDNNSYGSLQNLHPETEVTIFDLRGKQLFSGAFGDFDRDLLRSPEIRKTFVGLHAP